MSTLRAGRPAKQNMATLRAGRPAKNKTWQRSGPAGRRKKTCQRPSPKIGRPAKKTMSTLEPQNERNPWETIGKQGIWARKGELLAGLSPGPRPRKKNMSIAEPAGPHEKINMSIALAAGRDTRMH